VITSDLARYGPWGDVVSTGLAGFIAVDAFGFLTWSTFFDRPIGRDASTKLERVAQSSATDVDFVADKPSTVWRWRFTCLRGRRVANLPNIFHLSGMLPRTRQRLIQTRFGANRERRRCHYSLICRWSYGWAWFKSCWAWRVSMMLKAWMSLPIWW